MAGAWVRRIEDIEELAVAVRPLVRAVESSVESAGASARHVLSALEDRAAEIVQEVRSCEIEAGDAGDSYELETVAARAQELSEELSRLRAAHERVDEQFRRFRGAAARFDMNAARREGEVRAWLTRKAALLHAYLDAPSSARSTGPTSAPAAEVSPGTEQSFTTTPLPGGFRWVSLDEIDAAEIASLPDADSFRKVPYAKMQEGFALLRDEILPALRTGRGLVDPEMLIARDRELGRDGGGSSYDVFQAFFGTRAKEFIRVERVPGAGSYRISNGRHRIRVARDLGWKCVPAWVEGTSP